MEYDWPGNVRELRNAAEYYTLMRGTEESLPPYIMEKTFHPEGSAEEALLLREIQRAWVQDGGIGREALHALLREVHGVDISIYRLRLLLDVLRQRGWIEIRRGRQGIVPGEAYRTEI